MCRMPQFTLHILIHFTRCPIAKRPVVNKRSTNKYSELPKTLKDL